MSNGLSCGNGEILGGVLTLLISIAAFRAPGFSKAIVYLGGVVAAIGVVSVIPGLKDLAAVFGMIQIVWFVWMGVILFR